MLACFLLITTTLVESTAILFYVYNVQRDDDEKPNEKLLRKIDFGAAAVYAIAFIIFALVYIIELNKWTLNYFLSTKLILLL